MREAEADHMDSPPIAQMDLVAWGEELDSERRRHESINAERAARRGFIVFATDPTVDTDSGGYREVFATEAKTRNQAVAEVRPLADGRRLRAYLATGTYKHELAEARWVA
jgi:hypothetical protein